MPDLAVLLSFLLSVCFAPADVPSAQAGVAVQDEIVGEGRAAAAGDRVTIHFTAWGQDRRELASSEVRGLAYTLVLDDEAPLYFRLISGMAEGGERIVEVEPHLAHGLEGVPPIIPPASKVILKIRLIRVALP